MKFLYLVFIFAVLSTTKLVKAKKYIPAVEALISRLNDDAWDDDEKACLRNTLDILHGVQNGTLWATWVWDSMQGPLGVFFRSNYHLGNFDQCMEQPWQKERAVKYCLVNLYLEVSKEYKEFQAEDDSNDYLQTISKYGRVNQLMTFGVCLPSNCEASTIARIYTHMHNLTYLPEGRITVDPKDCQDPTKPVAVTANNRFWSCMKLLVCIAIFSTCYNILVTNKNPALEKITKSFCLKRNYEELFKSNSGEIKSMNGIRFLTACLIVSIHETVFHSALPLSNLENMDKYSEMPSGRFVRHTEVGVDTFFAMSGLLLVKGLMSKKKNLLVVLIKRYLRLLGPFAATLIASIAVFPHIGSGPIFNRSVRMFDAGVCKNYWWQSLLMINSDVDKMCYPISWSILCDFRLAVLGTLLFFIYTKNKKIGVISFVTVFVTMIFKLGYIVYANELDVVPIPKLSDFINMRYIPFINEVYFNYQGRVGPYFVGMTMGLIMGLYKPKDYRNVINKTSSFLLVAVSYITMLCVCGIYAYYADRPYNRLEVAMVAALNRTVWAAAVCCIIGCCEYGNIALLNNFLGHAFFTPLSKLSYCIYLIHILVLGRNLFTARSYSTDDIFSTQIKTFGNIVVSSILSLMLHLIVEAPMINLSNEIFSEKKPNPNTNGTLTNGNTVQNGVSNGKMKEN